MSVVNAIPLIAAGDDGYSLSRSLRFRQSATAYLSRTYATPTSTTTGTISFWYKRGLVGNSDLVTAFGTVSTTTGNGPYLQFTTNGALRFVDQSSDVITSAFFRDPAAWYHFVLAIDTTQATAANRLKFYVNGVQITSFSSATYGAQNYASNILASGTQYIGYSQPSNARGSDGYMAEVNFIDGQALTPSSFGAFSIYNQWLPKKYAGTYGTNGFYLPFTNNASAATLGNDFSGNSNTWTTNNISVTAGNTYDSMTDVPTLTSATAANYAVLNAVDASLAPTNGNLGFAQPAAAYATVRGTIGMTTGKWAWEVFVNTGGLITFLGIANSSTPRPAGAAAAGAWMYNYDGTKYSNGAGPTAYGASYTTGDTLRFEFDADAGSLVVFKNNTSQGVLVSGLAAGTYFPWAALYNNGASVSVSYNFGQRPFTNTPTSGYVALNTYNL